jgi:hypothetical protein
MSEIRLKHCENTECDAKIAAAAKKCPCCGHIQLTPDAFGAGSGSASTLFSPTSPTATKKGASAEKHEKRSSIGKGADQSRKQKPKKRSDKKQRKKESREVKSLEQLEAMDCKNADNKKFADKIITVGKKVAANKNAKKAGMVYTYCIAAESVKNCAETIRSGEHARELGLSCNPALQSCVSLRFAHNRPQTFKKAWPALLTKRWVAYR